MGNIVEEIDSETMNSNTEPVPVMAAANTVGGMLMRACKEEKEEKDSVRIYGIREEKERSTLVYVPFERVGDREVRGGGGSRGVELVGTSSATKSEYEWSGGLVSHLWSSTYRGRIGHVDRTGWGLVVHSRTIECNPKYQSSNQGCHHHEEGRRGRGHDNA